MKNPQIDRDGNKRWYNKKGQLHRKKGPAIEAANGDVWWFLDGERYTLEEYLRFMPIEVAVELRLKY